MFNGKNNICVAIYSVKIILYELSLFHTTVLGLTVIKWLVQGHLEWRPFSKWTPFANSMFSVLKGSCVISSTLLGLYWIIYVENYTLYQYL